MGEASETPSGRPVSPAAHLAEAFAAATVVGPRAVRLREVPFQTMIGIRADVRTTTAERLGAELGTALPARCGEVAVGGPSSVLWLSPDEFLLVSDAPAIPIVDQLTQALGEDPGSVIDLSANRTTFELAGPAARAVLEKGCPLDLHPRALAVGTAYLTVLGSVAVLLWKVDQQSFRILPRSSFADYLGRWLIDAMAEFAGAEVT